MAYRGHLCDLAMFVVCFWVVCGFHLSSEHVGELEDDAIPPEGVARRSSEVLLLDVEPTEVPEDSSPLTTSSSSAGPEASSGKSRPKYRLHFALSSRYRAPKRRNNTRSSSTISIDNTSSDPQEVDSSDISSANFNGNSSLGHSNCSQEYDRNSSTANGYDDARPCLSLQSIPSAWYSALSDQELLCVINPHWLEFEPPSHVMHVILTFVYLIILVVGCLGNAAVVLLFASSRPLRTASNLLILNLAISDFFLLSTISALVHNSVHEGPVTGRIGCDMYGFMGGLTGTTSIMTLAAISLDRYLVISFPLDPFKRFSHRQVIIIIMLTWMYSFTFSVIPLTGIVGIHYSPEGYLTSCSFDYLTTLTRTRVYIFSFFIAAWVLPLYIISFSYISIVNTVSKQDRHCYNCQEKLAKSFKHHSIRGRKRVEVKLAKVASGIIALWILAWTPYAIVALLGIFNQRRLITPLASMIPAIFCKTAACLDPYVYALSHPRFKKELRKRICSRRKNVFDVGRNGAPGGFSGSTVSEIREERELSEPQGWDFTDNSSSTIGPLLQRSHSCSSHPAVNTETTKSRSSVGSPGSKSLISPSSSEIYPRQSISSYSFRGVKSLNLHEVRELNKTKEVPKRFPESSNTSGDFQTTILMEDQVINTVNRIVSDETRETLLSSESLPSGPSKIGLSQTMLNDLPVAESEVECRLSRTLPVIADHQHLTPDINSSSHLEMTLLPISRLHAVCVTSENVTCCSKRSCSLPNIIDSSEDGLGVDILSQLFHGKILYRGTKNNSFSSINHVGKKSESAC